MKTIRGLAVTAGLGLAACSPVEQPLCGAPATALEVTTRTEADDRITTRTERSGSAGNGLVIRIETADGRLLALDEQPPLAGASLAAASRSVVVAYDDADRLTEASIIELDAVGRPASSWQVALSYTADGDVQRIEALGQPPASTVLDDILGAVLPGPSDGELTWLHPLPGADLLGPLPADVGAVVDSLPAGTPIAMAADISPIDDGLRADWVVSSGNLRLVLPVEHVADDGGWTRTWVGDGALQAVSLTWSLDPEGADGDGDLIWRLEGADFEHHVIRTVPIDGGTRRQYDVRREGALARRQIIETTATDIEARSDLNGDGVDDELRVQIPAGDGRTIEVIDLPPFGPVDLYRFTEVEDATIRVHTVAAGTGQQLCAVDGGPVTLEGEPGARQVVGVPDGLPDPPPQ